MKKILLILVMFMAFNTNALAYTGNNVDTLSVQLLAGDGCESILGSATPNSDGTKDPAYYLQFIFNLMKYAAIALLFVLTVMDFAKATFAAKDDALKKALNTAIKRFLIAVIIFFLPALIEMLFEIIGLYNSGTCGIGK